VCSRLLSPAIFGLVTEDELRKEITIRLGIARQAAGLTLADLGKLLGAPEGDPARQLAYRLSSKPPAAWVRLRKACEALGVSADWLLGAGPRLPTSIHSLGEDTREKSC